MPGERLPEPTKEESLDSADDLIPFCAFCCFISSCYADWPECCGCRNKGTCLCMQAENVCCKPSCNACGNINKQLKKYEKSMCVCFDGDCVIVEPESCCMGTVQCFLADIRVGCPPGAHEDVPCVVNICFFNCCYQWECKVGMCTNLRSYNSQVEAAGGPVKDAVDDNEEENLNEQSAPPAPAALEMEERLSAP